MCRLVYFLKFNLRKSKGCSGFCLTCPFFSECFNDESTIAGCTGLYKRRKTL